MPTDNSKSQPKALRSIVIVIALVLVGAASKYFLEDEDVPHEDTRIESTQTPTGTVAAENAGDPVPQAVSELAPEAWGEVSGATLAQVIDGDTIRTDKGRVRIIGIDTPEREECGYEDARTTVLDLMSVGDPVILVLPEGMDDTDRYDRLLRYVYTEDGVDVGLAQLEAGNAVARYDSTENHAYHPKEAAYHEAQIARLTKDRKVITTACE